MRVDKELGTDIEKFIENRRSSLLKNGAGEYNGANVEDQFIKNVKAVLALGNSGSAVQSNSGRSSEQQEALGTSIRRAPSISSLFMDSNADEGIPGSVPSLP